MKNKAIDLIVQKHNKSKQQVFLNMHPPSNKSFIYFKVQQY